MPITVSLNRVNSPMSSINLGLTLQVYMNGLEAIYELWKVVFHRNCRVHAQVLVEKAYNLLYSTPTLVVGQHLHDRIMSSPRRYLGCSLSIRILHVDICTVLKQ
jgi:hypothetical protein